MDKERSRVTVVITHTDLDGVGGAASYLRLKDPDKYEVIFTEPEDLPDALEYALDKYNGYLESIAIIDLAPNSSTIDKIVIMLKRAVEEVNASVEWFDHHIWSDSWERAVRDVGVRLYRNTSTCATGVVINVLEGSDSVYSDLESAVCSADLWRFNDPRSPWLNRLISVGRSDTWRYIVLTKLIKASSIDEVLEWGRKYVIDLFDKELKLYEYYKNKSRVYVFGSVKVVAVVKRYREIGTSQLAHYLITQRNSDIAVIIHRSGAISFRSSKCDVRAIAIKLGGGGHKPAAGAFIRLPLIVRFFNMLRIYRPLLNFAMKKVEDAVLSVGCNRIR